MPRSEDYWLKIAGEVLAKYICIPKDYVKTLCPHDPPDNDIHIDMRDVQIINIDTKSQTITLNMEILFVWFDDRIQLMENSQESKVKFYALDKSNHDKIWTPFFKIKNLVEMDGYDLDGG